MSKEPIRTYNLKNPIHVATKNKLSRNNLPKIQDSSEENYKNPTE